jgi:Tfp pilus assembly protein PilO
VVPDWAVGVAVICVSFFGGVGILTRIANTAKKDKGLRAEDAERLERLEGQVAELEQAQHRMAELEERVDFAERLLARQNDVERLAPPRN